MKNITRIVFVLFFAFGLAACTQSTQSPAEPEKPPVKTDQTSLYLDLKDGRVEIRLRPDLAPEHVARITALADQGFYDGIVFHRVIDGFMAQTGDPTGTGRGGSDMPDVKAEFSDTPFKRGILGMARSQNVDSANSQFFIMLADGESLNGQYTVFGEVTKGMEFIDGIKKGDRNLNGKVTSPDTIVKLRSAAAEQ